MTLWQFSEDFPTSPLGLDSLDELVNHPQAGLIFIAFRHSPHAPELTSRDTKQTNKQKLECTVEIELAEGIISLAAWGPPTLYLLSL